MKEDEKIEFANLRKEVATNLVKSKRFELALERYKRIVDMFNYIENFQDDNKFKARELKKACELNKALCYLKIEEPTEAQKACDTVLKDDSTNTKALFRKAQADVLLKNFNDAMSGLKRLLSDDPKNAEVLRLLQQAKNGQKEVDKKCKGMYAKMCGGLGKIGQREKENPAHVMEEEAVDRVDQEMA